MSEFLTFAAHQILNKVAALAAPEFSLVWGFKGELTQLRESFSMLEALLRDAKQSQGRGEAVEIWVKKLEDIAHDADDVLDEYGYELLRRKVELQNQMEKKVLNFLSLSNPIAFRFKMAHKFNNINKSLVILSSKAVGIGLVAKPMVEATTSHNIRVDRETHSGFKIDENNIFGRDQVLLDIVGALTNSKNNQESCLSVMAIVGLGGLGKTTLAKKIYHDGKIDAYFHEKLWVCVSTPFEIKSILRGVMESLKSKNAAVQTKEAMCRVLKEELQGKRYFLVLDDVWNEDSHKWDDLMSCLLGGPDTRGSKIIVTTRSDKVGKIVETLLPRPDLEKLSVEDCWRIMKDKSMGSSPITEDQAKIGRRIATKCGGVPLVAKVLGGMMRSKTSDEWLEIEKNTIWDLPEEESRILSVLKLSFDELKSSSLKQCFAYCSLFMKDFEIEKDDLIQLWMAQGLLHPSPNQDIEDRGNAYFSTLLQNSFFQDVTKDELGIITHCKMHDLLHDLAQQVSKSTFKEKHVSGSTSLARDSNMRSEKLYSFFSDGGVVPVNILPRFKVLRVLKLYRADIKELPVTIGKLKHLRYLDVSDTQITALPKSIGKLYNLQTLRMHNLKLEELPNELSNLINLRHVYFGERNWNVSWIKNPVGMGKLTNLRSLSSFTVGKEKGCGIEELADLNQLKGELCISKLELVRDGNEAKKANLVRKTNIRKLRFRWSDEDDRPSSNNMNDEDVLEGLQPLPNNLELLHIHNFMGAKFPLWKGSTPNNLKVIQFAYCNCKEVPRLGHLPNLGRVLFYECHSLKCVGSEFYGYNDVVAIKNSGETKVLFPALKTLHIKFANNLIEWMGGPTDSASAVFPCLEELLLLGCGQLTSAPSHFPALMKLDVNKCDGGIIASILSDELTTLTHLKIREVKRLASLPEGMLPNNKNLASLDLSMCPELTCIGPRLGLIDCCTSLRSLRIWWCHKLRYIPDGINPLSLKELIVHDCKSLESIPISQGLTSLNKLSLLRCPELSILPQGLQHCTSLEHLEIQECSKITSIPITQGQPLLYQITIQECPELLILPSGIQYCTFLQYLTIIKCQKLTSISADATLISLQELLIEGCSNLTSIPIPHVLPSLRSLVIVDCPELSSLSPTGLERHVSLEKLTIRECHNLETVPSLDKLTNLRDLAIYNCAGLTSLPSELASSPHLQTLEIGGFSKELDSFPAFQVTSAQLRSLTIYGWPKLNSLPEHIQHLTSLSVLNVEGFPELEAIPEWLGNLASLLFLSIESCKGVMYLPSVQAMRRLTEITVIEINDCPILKERCNKETGDEWPKISHIPVIRGLW